jgi:hypothetical protein
MNGGTELFDVISVIDPGVDEGLSDGDSNGKTENVVFG